ncbi:tetratricopeptide repeat protein [Pseudorhizobium endolithicum]|uniref:Tetratricopeptide repeat protein n=1 Tax=Pseudorhizobium endolithicum TaxID=1191678 RepID=A0ABM8PWZ1_9HYPH|nr:tetratricopeptide repeat protein [Pseudorhizobium endolithicum]CAD7053097.1 tetratricopeptide repeat protein [Pseudorhizobium endolithicum]
MRHKFNLFLLSGAALAMALSLAGAPRAATPEGKPKDETVTFEPAKVQSFAGAFLAARTADVDHDYPTAITLYRKALEFDAANLEIRERLMISLFLNGDFDEGLAEAEALKDDEAVERITTIVRGLDAIRDGRYDEAKKLLAYDGSNDLDKLTHSLISAWADVGAGREKQALQSVRSMDGPEWFKVFTEYQLGMMALVAGDAGTAREHLTAAITNQDAVATAPDTFMRGVMALARLEAAAGNKQKALDAISVGDEMISNYAPLKALRESIENGDKPAQQVSDATEGAASVLFSIGAALNRQGAEDMVSLYLQVSHALDPESADTLILLGGIAEKLEKPERAIGYYEQVPAGSPMRRISELQLGLALAGSDQIEEAREHLKELIAADPSDIRSYLAYGSVLSDAKDYAEMASNYDKAVEVIGPVPKQGDWTIFFQRGIAYERLKKWEQAEPNFKKALELNPEQPQVLNYLGYSWVDMNRNLEEGLDMIRRAVELRPDDGYIVDSLGWAYYRMGRLEEAVTELERAVQLRAGDATINDHLGDAYWRVGRKLEAVYQWNRALVSEGEDVNREQIKEKIEKGLPPLDPDATTAKNGAAEPEMPAPPPATEPDKKS